MCLRGLHASTRIEATKTHTSLPTRKMDALSISGHALTMTPRLTCHAMRSWLGACRVHELLTRDENQRKKIHFAGFVKKWHATPEAPLGELCPLGFLARPARRAATRSLFSVTWGFAAALRKTYQNWQPCPELSTAAEKRGAGPCGA